MGGSRSARAFLALLIAASPAHAARMNSLSREKSPYLLQHADNPVDWRPWGEEAFAEARRANKPVFLSIGYSTCHWCHVMERESFSDPETAELMNRRFVSVKVDREERPDVDKVYMSAAMGAGWGGGWPLSVWLTPEKEPFFGGTYFPPEPRWGQPGFRQVLAKVAEVWEKDPEAVRRDGRALVDALRESSVPEGEGPEPEAGWLDRAFKALAADFDERSGGFSTAPKFPMPAQQALLLRHWARSGQRKALDMALLTLAEMAKGGIYDHVGGGFHRYSTDARWRVPHFEKMLYDNAQLAVNYIEAYQAVKDPELARVARETLGYLLREMTHPEGGFYSAEDADSLPPGAPKGAHKAEGAFYLWTAEELRRLLGPETAGLYAFRYGVEEDGNAYHDPHGEFSGRNILYAARTVAETAEKAGKSEAETARLLAAANEKLRKERAKRPRPHLDDKILASWNGLTISALAKGAQVLEDPELLAAARKAARFLRAELYDPASKTLYHRWRDGHRAVPGLADDYAFLAAGLIDLYEADFDPAWLDWALELNDEMLRLFGDPEGGVYMTRAGGADLVVRVMEDHDNVEPSASSVAAANLLRLSWLADRKDLREAAAKTLRRFGTRMREQPRALPQMLCAVDFALAKPRQVVVAGDPEDPGTREILRLTHARLMPSKVLIVVSEKTRARLAQRLPFLKGVVPIGGKPTAYVCVNYACELPTNDLAEIKRILDGTHAPVGGR